MQQQKYIELKTAIHNLSKSFESTTQKVMSQHRLLQSTITLCKNFDNRIEVIKKVLKDRGLMLEEEFEALMDAETGMTKLTETDIIKTGDVVWVSYEATEEGTTTKITEDNLPIRAGAKALLFDEAVIGKKIGDTFDFTGKWEGADVNFKIKILKAKCKIGGEDGDGDAADNAGQDKSDVTPGGPGHEELGASSAQPVQ